MRPNPMLAASARQPAQAGQGFDAGTSHLGPFLDEVLGVEVPMFFMVVEIARCQHCPEDRCIGSELHI